MSVRQLWEGTDAAPWMQKLNGRTKLIVLFLFAILTITIDNPRSLFVLFSSSYFRCNRGIAGEGNYRV